MHQWCNTVWLWCALSSQKQKREKCECCRNGVDQDKHTHTHTYWGKEKVKQTHQLCATKHTKTARWSNGSQLPMVLCRKDEWSRTWRGRQWKHTCTRAHARFICILIMRRDSYITMCTAQRREAARFNWRQHECVRALLCIKRNHKLVRYFIHVAHSEWGDKWGDRRREEQGIKRWGDKGEGKVVGVLVDRLGSFLHLRCDDPIELKVNLEKIWAPSLFIYLLRPEGGGLHHASIFRLMEGVTITTPITALSG